MWTVRALLARSPKRNKRKVFSGSRVTLPENFACKPEASFNPLARVTLAVGLPYLLVNRALIAEYFFMLYTFYDRAFYTHGAIAYFERICFQLTTAAERDVKKSIKTNIKHQNKHS